MKGNSKKSKLLALFNTLEEDDKDVVIAMSESLAEKCKNNMTKIAGNIVKRKNKTKHRIV
ncbi:MAG: hypothetical protein FWH53_03015 [Leptospirales bacterium]|nr:hypothetical protein [Leptospirales bacterium]